MIRTLPTNTVESIRVDRARFEAACGCAGSLSRRTVAYLPDAIIGAGETGLGALTAQEWERWQFIAHRVSSASPVGRRTLDLGIDLDSL